MRSGSTPSTCAIRRCDRQQAVGTGRRPLGCGGHRDRTRNGFATRPTSQIDKRRSDRTGDWKSCNRRKDGKPTREAPEEGLRTSAVAWPRLDGAEARAVGKDQAAPRAHVSPVSIRMGGRQWASVILTTSTTESFHHGDALRQQECLPVACRKAQLRVVEVCSMGADSAVAVRRRFQSHARMSDRTECRSKAVPEVAHSATLSLSRSLPTNSSCSHACDFAEVGCLPRSWRCREERSASPCQKVVGFLSRSCRGWSSPRRAG